MTARGLIDDIFGRAQMGVAPNMRRITPGQLKYLRDLIEADREAGAVTTGALGSLVWMPEGGDRYVLAEDLRGNKHTLTRLRNFSAEMGSLF
jgi:hypothetical protein